MRISEDETVDKYTSYIK